MPLLLNPARTLIFHKWQFRCGGHMPRAANVIERVFLPGNSLPQSGKQLPGFVSVHPAVMLVERPQEFRVE